MTIKSIQLTQGKCFLNDILTDWNANFTSFDDYAAFYAMDVKNAQILIGLCKLELNRA